ncbi:MAG: DUF262 domain-containing protein [Gammaproteobacteria bacterium]|nr:DUF262 domain-containing protein [Gammaproteobacteria bacterium]
MNNHIEELKAELEQEQNVEDLALEDEDEGIARYDISSYGVDFDVDGLVRRIKRGDIFIPPFQRKFVWDLTESSRFIESFLLGLPVPGIFLAQEPESRKLLIIDGQQRLLSLLYFFEGYFNPKENGEKKEVFKLSKVQSQYEHKTCEMLAPRDRINLENSLIHATVVKQDDPAEDDTSIHHLFERLNSGGRKLTHQEIRTAVYHGEFVERIKGLNENKSWRKIYGKVHNRMKDQELIIRFFAMREGYSEYKSPMTDFLSKFTKKHRSDSNEKLTVYSNTFIQCCELFEQINNGKPFRLGTSLNAAFFEAAMVGLANRISEKKIPESKIISAAYDRLRNNESFLKSISQSTGNSSFVKNRIEIAKQIFLEA